MNNDPRYEQLKQEQETSKQKALDVTSGLKQQSENITSQQNQFLDDYQRGQQELIGRGIERETQNLERAKVEQEKGFQKEAGAAFTDYQQFVNPYGVQAEKQAMEGVTGTGFSETSKVRAFGDYQKRYSMAKDTMEKNKMAADIAINDAKLKGDIQAAQIAFETFQQKNANILRNFEYTSNLAWQQLATERSIEQDFYGRSQNLQSQMNTERQQAFQREQAQLSQSNWEREFQALQKEKDRNYALARQKAVSNQPMNITDTQNQIGDTGTAKLVSNKSPLMSSKTAQTWLEKNIVTPSIKAGGLTIDELNKLLTEGKNNKILNDTDIIRVAKSYGIN